MDSRMSVWFGRCDRYDSHRFNDSPGRADDIHRLQDPPAACYDIFGNDVAFTFVDRKSAA